jgi:predicted enzyme related to lactoylglutathione lyase
MITDLAFVLYPVKAMPRARAFYEQTFGLRPGDAFGESWIEYQAGSAIFAITDAIPFKAPAASVAFEVDDLDATVSSLKAANVPFEGDVSDFPACRMALIQDPDGNTLCIHQRKK